MPDVPAMAAAMPHVPAVDREQRAAASRYVLSAARDRDDLRLLLTALGLQPDDRTDLPTMEGSR